MEKVMTILNLTGKPCPIPVIEAKKALRGKTAGESLSVLVDNDISRQNLQKMAEGLGHGASTRALAAERAFMRRLGVGCSVPVGALCQEAPGGQLSMKAALAIEGQGIVWAEGDGAGCGCDEAAALGLLVAERILEGTPR
jgi:TusA-related sulfurtransferase